jgi:hypothetical protein
MGIRLGVVFLVIEKSLRPFIVADDCVVFDLTIFEPDKQRDHSDCCQNLKDMFEQRHLV